MNAMNVQVALKKNGAEWNSALLVDGRFDGIGRDVLISSLVEAALDPIFALEFASGTRVTVNVIVEPPTAALPAASRG